MDIYVHNRLCSAEEVEDIQISRIHKIHILRYKEAFDTLVTGMTQATELIHTIIIFISSLWLLEARIIHLKIGTYNQ